MLRKFNPECADNYPVEGGTTVGGLLEHLGVPQDDVKFIFISGREGNVASPLYGGERVTIFPVIVGG